VCWGALCGDFQLAVSRHQQLPSRGAIEIFKEFPFFFKKRIWLTDKGCARFFPGNRLQLCDDSHQTIKQFE